ECDSHIKKITEILDTLIDNTTYDRRLRPKHGEEPVNVGITIHVSSISAVSEVNMDFTVDFYLRQTWNDPRLAFSHYLYDAYSVLDIVYLFNNSRNSVSKSEFELPQFVLIDIQVESRNIVLSSGFYVIQVYLPCILIVVISWVSFWLNRDATPARVALSVLTILTMTTLTATANASMPKVSYVKSIDIFLGVSFVMVFSSLLEFAAVGYISKRIKLIQKRRKDLHK
ncbi:unnamed protein product, partial [Acanthocheilonema viteae]